MLAFCASSRALDTFRIRPITKRDRSEDTAGTYRKCSVDHCAQTLIHRNPRRADKVKLTISNTHPKSNKSLAELQDKYRHCLAKPSGDTCLHAHTQVCHPNHVALLGIAQSTSWDHKEDATTLVQHCYAGTGAEHSRFGSRTTRTCGPC